MSKGKEEEEIRSFDRQAALPWVEKYRPKNFDELISHGHILATINKLMDQQNLPHLLFYGPPGTGKTSTILACARKLYGDNYKPMILELNASDDRGIQVVRDQIKTFASTQKIFSTGVKLIILDEADNLTKDAQAALRRVIEKYTKNTRFCLICNYVSKIIPALQSRCTRFRFAPLDVEQTRPRLQYICEQEGVDLTPDGLEAALRLGKGDMRRCLNVLQATHMSFQHINEVNVYLTTGAPLPSDIKQILQWLLNCSSMEAFNNVQRLKAEKGLALQDLLTELHALTMSIDLGPNQMVLMSLLHILATIEANLAAGATERIQLGSLVGAYQQVRLQLTQQAAAAH